MAYGVQPFSVTVLKINQSATNPMVSWLLLYRDNNNAVHNKIDSIMRLTLRLCWAFQHLLNDTGAVHFPRWPLKDEQ